MKITVTHYDETVTIEHLSDDLDIDQMRDVFIRLLVAMGFSESTARGGLGETEG